MRGGDKPRIFRFLAVIGVLTKTTRPKPYAKTNNRFLTP